MCSTHQELWNERHIALNFEPESSLDSSPACPRHQSDESYAAAATTGSLGPEVSASSREVERCSRMVDDMRTVSDYELGNFTQYVLERFHAECRDP